MTTPTKPKILTTTEELFNFPTEYPLKVVGKNRVTLKQDVVAILVRHIADFDTATVSVRESKGGKYLSVTSSFTAQSKAQLDNIYLELTAHPDILWAL